MNVVNFYAVLKTDFERLKIKTNSTLHSRATYKKALLIYNSPELFADSPLIRAWAFYVVTNQGFASKIWSRGYDKWKAAQTFQNRMENFQQEITERLAQTQIEQNDAYKVIQSRDSEDAFFYCDPPYVNTNQWHYGGYSEEHFMRDLDVLARIKWKFLLSNYPWPILLDFIKQYKRYVRAIDKPLTAWNRIKAGQGRRKTELLVANYPI